jgi:hypothetical protein
MQRNACRPVPTQGILLNQCYKCGKEVTDDRETKCNNPVILPESIWAVISIPRYIYNPHSHITPLKYNYNFILRFFLCAQGRAFLHFTVTHQLVLLTFRLVVQVLVIQ